MRKKILAVLCFAFLLSLTGCDSTTTPKSAEIGTSSTAGGKEIASFATGGLDSKSGRIIVGSNKVITQDGEKLSLGERLASVFAGSRQVNADQVSQAQGQTSLITTLPKDAKRVRVFSSTTIAFLKDTDGNDHAKTLAIRDINKDSEQAVYRPSDNFLIDEYVVSPDKKKAAVWEVKLADGSDQLLGGISRVVEVNLANGGYQVLFTQSTKQPSDSKELQNLWGKLDSSVFVQYPLFYDASNTLYLDTFGPNGGGWGNGIYTYDASSRKLAKYSALPAGSYSSDPVGAESGTIFVVAEPNSSYGETRSEVIKAQGESTKLVVFEGGKQSIVPLAAGVASVGNVVISSDAKTIAYVGRQKITGTSGESTFEENTFIYDRSTGKTVELKSNGFEPVEFVANGVLVLGKPDTTSYATADGAASPLVSNLGSKYSLNYSQYLVADPSQPENLQAFTPDGSGSVEHIQGAWRLSPASSAASTTTIMETSDRNNISLGYFVPRNVELATSRLNQQQASTSGSTPWCRDMFPGAFMMNGVSAGVSMDEFGKMQQAASAGKCLDSPLYLYPKEETAISVHSGAVTFNTSPASSNNAWDVIASPNGTIRSNGDIYDKISYDYIANAPAKSDGIVVTQSQLKPALDHYADKLLLNAKEKSDFVAHWMEKLSGTSPYIQISHYSLAQSAKIVALDINPRPDTFVPIVMYFRKLYSPISLPEPKFENFERRGFVALDWSGVIESN